MRSLLKHGYINIIKIKANDWEKAAMLLEGFVKVGAVDMTTD